MIESEAVLLPGSPSSWDRPYLNTVVEGFSALSPEEGLVRTQRIETMLGRVESPRWSPRVIDIDLLLWGDEQRGTDQLRIPHPLIVERDFVLTPLVHLEPRLVLPGETRTAWQQWLALPQQTPLWMAIVNVTPDSFSDGGQLDTGAALEAKMEQCALAGAHFIDIGAESTRPGGEAVSPDEEWRRLRPAIEAYQRRFARDSLAPRLSVDTRHVPVAEKALAAGAHVINDVSGLTEPDMIALARGSGVDWVTMHHTSLPVDPANLLPPDQDPVRAVLDWFANRLEVWREAGLDQDRIVIDPGIGFGKSASQSWEVLREVHRFTELEHRVLIGHSRKSFLQAVSSVDAAQRDAETVALSLGSLDSGVSIFRVHDVSAHQRAYRSWRRLHR